MQLVICLTAGPGFASVNPSSVTISLEVVHEIISVVILPLLLIEEGQL